MNFSGKNISIVVWHWAQQHHSARTRRRCQFNVSVMSAGCWKWNTNYFLSENSSDSLKQETPSKASRWENDCNAVNSIKEAVVVLTRLPDYKISALRPPTPPQFYSEDESLSSSGSDMGWESEEDSSDSDVPALNHKQNPSASASSSSGKAGVESQHFTL